MKNETIVDRVVLRLKAAPLGDLITEEDLHEIVKQAIPKVFFEPQRVETKDRWDGVSVQLKDPAIIEIMRAQMLEAAKGLVKAWLVEHADEVMGFWQKVIDKGLIEYVQAIQNEQATAHLKEALNLWVKDINDQRMNQGQMPLLAPLVL